MKIIVSCSPNSNVFKHCVFIFLGSNIDSRDIVDGHREKTLNLLWKIIFAFQVRIWLCVQSASRKNYSPVSHLSIKWSVKVEVILDADQLREEIGFLKKTSRTKRKLASLRADRGIQPSPARTRVPYEHGSTKVTLLMDWARAVCDFYNLRVSFSSLAKENTFFFESGYDFILCGSTVCSVIYLLHSFCVLLNC